MLDFPVVNPMERQLTIGFKMTTRLPWWAIKFLGLAIACLFLYLVDPAPKELVHSFLGYQGQVVRKGESSSLFTNDSSSYFYIVIETKAGNRLKRYINLEDFELVQVGIKVQKRYGFGQRLNWSGREEDELKREKRVQQIQTFMESCEEKMSNAQPSAPAERATGGSGEHAK